MRRCSQKYCRNIVDVRRVCRRCSNRKYRERHPVKAAYYNLKSNAKRRGKDFDISLQDFERWCVETDYIYGKGRTQHSFTIDRIDNSAGYTIDNIRKISNSENAKKGTRQLGWYDTPSGPVNFHMKKTSYETLQRDDSLPF